VSTVHLHLMLNHIPVVGSLFLVVLFAAGVVRGNTTVVRTALWTWAVLGAVALVAFLTGEPAEQAVEGLAGVSEAAIERHEDLALVATILLGAGAALSVAALALLRRRVALPRWVAMTGLAGSLVIAGAMGVTADLGGQIRHTELRGAGVAPTTEAVRDQEERRGDHDR